MHARAPSALSRQAAAACAGRRATHARAAVILCCVTLLACASAPRPVPPGPAELAARLPSSPLWVVSLRPAPLLDDPVVMRMADAVFGQARVGGWRSGTLLRPDGLAPLHEYPHLIVARYADGLVVLAPWPPGEPPPAPPQAGDLHRGEGWLVARAAGVPAAFDTLIDTTGAGAAGHPAPDEGATALAHLVANTAEPLAVLWPGHLPLPSEAGLGQVLADVRMTELGLTPPIDGVISLRVALHGGFPPGIEDHLQRFFVALRADPLGQAFGGEAALVAPQITVGKRVVTVVAQIPVANFERGIVLLFGDIRASLRDARVTGPAM